MKTPAILFLLIFTPLILLAQNLTEAMQSYYKLDPKNMQDQLETFFSTPQNKEDKAYNYFMKVTPCAFN